MRHFVANRGGKRRHSLCESGGGHGKVYGAFHHSNTKKRKSGFTSLGLPDYKQIEMHEQLSI